MNQTESIKIIDFLKANTGLPHKIVKKCIANGELKVNNKPEHYIDRKVNHKDKIIFRNKNYQIPKTSKNGNTIWNQISHFIGDTKLNTSKSKKRYILSFLTHFVREENYDLIINSEEKDSFRSILKTISEDDTFFKDSQKLKDRKLFDFLISKLNDVENDMNDLLRLSKSDFTSNKDLIQKFYRLKKSSSFNWLVAPLTHNEYSNDNIPKNLILTLIELDDKNLNVDKYKYYDTKKPIFIKYFEILKKYEENEYVKTFYKPLAENVFKSFKSACKINEDAEARILVNLQNRKYNLQNKNLDLYFIIENNGAGLATEISVTLKQNKIIKSERVENLGLLEPNESRQFQISTDYSPIDEIKEISVECEWINTSTKQSKAEFKLILQEQQQSIDWESLESDNTIYSLSKIESIENLFGRSSIMSKLLLNSNSGNIQSFKIWGQKRVGKSSIVKTLETELADDDSIIVSLITVPRNIEARETLNEIGNEICRSIKRKIRASNLDNKSDLLRVSISEFKGSLTPLKNYLEDLNDLNSNLKFILILDEVDRLNDEFFMPGNFGESFSLAIGKTINDYPFCGFILVGSENMNLLDYQQINYNAFIDEKVDTFDLETQYNDFTELVKRPVEGKIIYSDESINEIYNYTNGNPYFTNIVCKRILSDCCTSKSNEVYKEQVIFAIDKFIRSESKQSFAHYWDDGLIKDSKEKKDRLSDVRRRILIAYANYFDEKESIPTINNLIANFKFPDEYEVTDSEIRNVIQNFTSRGIFKIENSKVKIIPKLFFEWLCNGNGKNQIIEGVADLEAQLIQIEQNKLSEIRDIEIDRLLDKFNFQENIYSQKQIRQYLEQFGNNQDQRKVFKFLDSVHFVSNKDISKFFNQNRKIIFGQEIDLGSMKSISRNEGFHFLSSAKYREQNAPYFETFKKLNSILGTRKLKSCNDNSIINFTYQPSDVIVLFETVCIEYSDSFYEYIPFLNTIARLKDQPKVYIVILIASKQFLNQLEKSIDNIEIDNLNYILYQSLEISEISAFSKGSSVFENNTEKQSILAHINSYTNENQANRSAIIFEKFCPSQSVEILWNKNLSINPLKPNTYEIYNAKVIENKISNNDSKNDYKLLIKDLDDQVTELEEWMRNFIITELRKHKKLIRLKHITQNQDIIKSITGKIEKHLQRHPYDDKINY